MNFADFDATFRRSEAHRSLSDALVPGNDLDEEEFRASVDENLRSGKMRLIIAVDEITDELKRIVSYLNYHTTTNVEFLALEMRRAVDEGFEVLLPATYGDESAHDRERAAPRGQRLDRETLLASIRAQSALAGDAGEGILDWLTTSRDLTFATGRRAAGLRRAPGRSSGSPRPGGPRRSKCTSGRSQTMESLATTNTSNRSCKNSRTPA
jgi:hypothetical protein